MPDTIVNFSGFLGLNTTSPPGMVKDRELRICTNFDVGEAGELIRRPGSLLRDTYTNQDGAGLQFLGFYSAVKEVGEDLVYFNQIIFFVPHVDEVDPDISSGGEVRFTDDGFLTSTLIYDTSLYGQIAWGLQYNNLFYFSVVASAGIMVWDGTAATALGGSDPYGAVNAIVHKDRLWLAGVSFGVDTGDPSRLYFSEPGDFETWVDPISGATNSLDVALGDGDNIISFTILNDNLYIFKRFSTWVLYVQGDSSDDWVLRCVTNDLGCIGYKAVEEVEGVAYLVTHRGFYRFDGVNYTNLGERVLTGTLETIQPIVVEIEDTPNVVNTVVRFNNRLIFNGTYVFYYKLNVWSKWVFESELGPLDRFLTNGLYVYTRPESEDINGLYFTLDSDLTGLENEVAAYRVNDFDSTPVFKDVDNAYVSIFLTKDYDFGSPDEFKRLMWASIDRYSLGEFRCTVFTDGQDTDTVIAAVSPPLRSIVKVNGTGVGRRFGLEVDLDNNGESIIYGLGFRIRAKSRVSSRVTA